MTIAGRLRFSALALAVAALCTAELRAQQLPPPPNDDLANAAAVSGVEFQLAADLGAATLESVEPHSQFNRGHTAWWTWTAPEDGIYEWNSTASDNRIAVEVYQLDTFDQLTSIARTYRRPHRGGMEWVLEPEATGSFQAKQGARYAIQLDLTASYYVGSGFLSPGPTGPRPVSVGFRKSNLVAPPNDNFANRAALVGFNAVFTADLSAATVEPDEPQPSTSVLRRTLWWTWSAPGYGSAIIRKLGMSEAPVVSIYTRADFQPLQLLASSGTEFGNQCYRDPRAHDSVEWDTVPGGQYEVQIDRVPWFPATQAAELELVFVPAPPNDLPTEALALAGLEVSLTATNTGATKRTGELTIPTQSGSNSVWFRWTAPSRGVLQVTRFDPVRYSDPSYQPASDPGSDAGFEEWVPLPPCSGDFIDLHPPPPFVPVFGLFDQEYWLPDQPPAPTSLLTFAASSLIAEVYGGRDYWIELDGDQGSSGTTPLNLLLIPTPANDDFTDRIRLPSQPIRVTGRTFAATGEATDPVYVENNLSLARSVWWEWHAPSTGRWTLFVVKGGLENKFVVYRGDAATTGSEIKSTEHEPAVFNCQAGEAFQIGVFALAGFGGNIEFTLTEVVAPSPRLQSVRDDGWGTRSLGLQLPDNSGLPYVVERSEDLATWTPVATNANAWSHILEVRSEVRRPIEFFRTRFQDVPIP